MGAARTPVCCLAIFTTLRSFIPVVKPAAAEGLRAPEGSVVEDPDETTVPPLCLRENDRATMSPTQKSLKFFRTRTIQCLHRIATWATFRSLSPPQQLRDRHNTLRLALMSLSPPPVERISYSCCAYITDSKFCLQPRGPFFPTWMPGRDHSISGERRTIMPEERDTKTPPW